MRITSMFTSLLTCLTVAFIGLSCHAQANVDSANSSPVSTPAIVLEPVVTKHSVTIDGSKIDYEARAGHLLLTKEDGTPRAKIFFIAYTKTGVKDVSTRPITFSFNGGPGSSSVWLHIGMLGPKRVLMNDDGTTLPPPYKMIENDQSWLDLTDMVFIDPVSTGFSRAAKEENANAFHGYSQDIESVGDFIRRYVADAKRWSSPKFLIGESYGTTRASALSAHLQGTYGMYLNGVILVSAVLNFGTIDFAEGNDLPYAMFLPTYAATAWYHKKLPADMQSKSLNDVVGMAKDFTYNEYMIMLAKGDQLSSVDKQTLTQKLMQFTGLSADYIQKTYFRPVIYKYCQELLRDRSQVVGRFDSRYTGPEIEKTSEYQERDPSHHPTIAGCFATCINDYLLRDLEVKTTLPYEVLTGRVHPWDYSNVQNEYLNVAPRLRDAMISNPALKVWVANGYYDLATPVTAAEYTFAHMWLPDAMKGNVRMSYHEAGHMMYLLKTELVKMKSEAKSFYTSTAK